MEYFLMSTKNQAWDSAWIPSEYIAKHEYSGLGEQYKEGMTEQCNYRVHWIMWLIVDEALKVFDKMPLKAQLFAPALIIIVLASLVMCNCSQLRQTHSIMPQALPVLPFVCAPGCRLSFSISIMLLWRICIHIQPREVAQLLLNAFCRGYAGSRWIGRTRLYFVCTINGSGI